jgi:integrase
MTQWLEDHVKATKAPLTYRGYEQTARMYIIPRLGRIPLERLSGQDVQRCLNQASKDGLSPTSVKNINATLKTALSTGKRWGYVERNAAKDATPPKQKKFAAKALTVEQSERLLKVMAGHRYEALIVVALMMGLRRGEVAALRWSEIDFADGFLHVRTALQRIKGKGVQLHDVKSEKSHRHSPLPALCIAALLRLREMQEEEKRAAGTKWKQDSDFVFTSRYGARIGIEEPIRELKSALKLAKLPDARFHDLRHSTASLLLAKGVPMKIVQEIMGHANFQITMDTYSHVLPSQLRDAMETMNDIFEKPVVAPVVAPTTRQRIQ